MHVMEPHHILKVKNAMVKSVYYFMQNTFASFLWGGGEPTSNSKMRHQVPSQHCYLLINIQDSIW